MASISKTVRPKRSNNASVNPVGMGLTVGRGTPVATGVDGTATVLFTETFADSNFASRGWYDLSSTDRVASPAPPGMPGSLRMTWNSGATVPSTGTMRKAFTATDRLYVKYQQSFSANWVGSGQNYHPHLVMCLSDQDGAYESPSDCRLAIYSEVSYASGNRPSMQFQDNQYIDIANLGANVSEARATCGANGQQGYADYWDSYSFPGLSHDWYNARGLRGSVVMATGNTAWHTVEVEVILNSVVGGVGQLDGICRYWWDGVLQWERTNLIMRTGTRPNLKFNQFLFAPYIGDGSPVTQTTYFADLTVATGRIAGGGPPPSAAITGTATSDWYEADVVTGGDTIILTLTNDTWVASGTTFNGQRQAIIDGLVAASSPTNGWNNQRANIPVTAVVQTSTTVVTITLPALAGYSVTANETITATVPGSAVTAAGAIVATPTLTITEGASGSGTIPELPSGLTLHASYPVNPLASSGWGYGNQSGTATYIANSPPELDLLYPSGMSGGNEPSVHYRSPGASRIFWTYEFKYSSGFVGHSSGVNKHTFLFGSSSGVICYTQTRFSGAASTGKPDVQFQDASTTPNHNQRLGVDFGTSPDVTLTNWNRHSVFWDNDANTFQGWSNGTLYGTVTGMNTQSSGEYQIAATWGGIGGTVPANQHLYIRNLQIWTG